MTPILFPYTYVSEPMAEILAVFFEKIVVYQPIRDDLPPEMQALKQQGFLEIRTPEHEDDHEIKAVIKDYQNWAQLHQGHLALQGSLLKALDPKVPFFDDSATARILADLKSETRSKSDQHQQNPLFHARLFLHFAQEYDRHTLEIETDFGRYEEKAQNLINELKAETDQRADEFHRTAVHQPSAPDDLMLPGRLSAWTHMLLHDPEISGLFVTTSLAAFETVKDISADTEVIFHADGNPVMNDPNPESRNWQHSLIAHLSALSENNSPATIQKLRDLFAHQPIAEAAVITICRVAGLSPPEFFGQVRNPKATAPESARLAPENKYNLIIIGVFQKKNDKKA